MTFATKEDGSCYSRSIFFHINNVLLLIVAKLQKVIEYQRLLRFIMQNVDFDIQSHCMSLKKSKGNDIQSGTKHNFGYFQESFPGLKP